MKSFASDNYSGVHPAVFRAMEEANRGHAPAYGADSWTARAEEKVRTVFGPKATPFFLFNGTGANVTALQALLKPYEAVICSQHAHIHQDECGAPERMTGAKLIDLPAPGGKLRAEQISALGEMFNDQHKVQPRVLSLSQSTEKGTVYSSAELSALRAVCETMGIRRHIDGARFANAVIAWGGTDAAAQDILQSLGCDALSFGGTKNGLMGAEAVVVFSEELAERMKFHRKQSMQLASKMRFLSAQYLAYFDFWLDTARHANAMASLLAGELGQLAEVKITEAVQANAVFARLPAQVIPELQKEFPFYVWDSSRSEVRLMASFDTTEAEIRAFVAKLKQVLS